jgi:anti-anti-sigma factor
LLPLFFPALSQDDPARAVVHTMPDAPRGRRRHGHPQWSERMNVTTEFSKGLAIVRVGETRLMYPMLADFSATVSSLIARGEKKLIIDLTPVTYVDSATIGCFMDLYRQATAANATLKLGGVQKRVETMLTMTGAHNFLQLHPDQASAIRSFEG